LSLGKGTTLPVATKHTSCTLQTTLSAQGVFQQPAGHGRVRKSGADRKAKQEYEQFEERRRALKEARGEEESLRALEELARRSTGHDNDKDGEDGS